MPGKFEATTEHADIARAILDANLYMTLATADEFGRPWAAPVYFAHEGYRELFWVAQPRARHSRNLAERTHLGIVVFDSQQPIDTGHAVAMTGHAAELTGEELKAGIAVFSQRSQAHGASAWTAGDVAEPDGVRLYRATVDEAWVLDRDTRIGVTL